MDALDRAVSAAALALPQGHIELLAKALENLTGPSHSACAVFIAAATGAASRAHAEAISRRQTVHEQHRLEEKLKRIKHQYREGDIDQREYEREMGLTKSALAAVEPPVDAHLVVLGDHVEGLVEAWDVATKEERHQLLAMMLDAVYVDMKNAEVVGVKPKPAFLPLFNLREPVKSGETILVTSELDQGRSIPETRIGRHCCSNLVYATVTTHIRKHTGLAGIVQQAMLIRVGSGLGAVGGSGLGQDVAHVAKHRVEGNDQFFGDLPVAPSGGNEAQHFHFSVGQAIGVGQGCYAV